MDMTVLAAERDRFAKVVAARKTNKDLFELFDKLKVSDKFTEPAKPYLALDLVEACVHRVSERQLIKLLQAMEASGTVAFICDTVPQEHAEPILSRLVRKVLQSCPLSEGSLMEAFLHLERSGVCAERGEALDMAIRAGMATDELDIICNLTFEAYYLCT